MEKSSSFYLSSEQVVNRLDFRRFDRLLCSICQNILFNPCRCSQCSMHYCKSCISLWLEKSSTCPHCRQPLKIDRFEKTLKEDLDDLIFKCKLEVSGCTERINYESIEKHEKCCPFEVIKCSFCEITNFRAQIKEHEQVCEMRQINCECCKGSIHHSSIKDHQIICYRNRYKEIEKDLLDFKKKVENFKEKKVFKFSSNNLYKHDDIRITSNIAEMKSDIPRLSGTILIKPKLTSIVNCIRIKIKAIGCFIGLGIGNATILSRNKFVLNDYQLENMQHGCYLISDNGFKFSHDSAEENLKAWNGFQIDDVIQINFNRQNLNVSFKVENKGNVANLTVKQKFLDNFIYFVVVLGGIYDCVEIMNEN